MIALFRHLLGVVLVCLRSREDLTWKTSPCGSSLSLVITKNATETLQIPTELPSAFGSVLSLKIPLDASHRGNQGAPLRL